MTTQRKYSHGVAGFLVLALLVVLGTGCCGDNCSKKPSALETDNQVPEIVGDGGTSYAEDDAEMICDEPAGQEYESSMPMGYREPGYTDVTEECGLADEEGAEDRDEASMPALTEEEDTLAQNNEEWNEDSAARDEAGADSGVTEEGKSMLSDGNDEGSSVTVTPWISGAEEEPSDPNLDDTMSDTTDTPSDAPVGD